MSGSKNAVIEKPSYNGPIGKAHTIVEQWLRWSDVTPSWERPGKSDKGYATLRVQGTLPSVNRKDPDRVWMQLSAVEAGDKSRRETSVCLTADQMRALRARIDECLGDR
jgi:hypothetical protein